MPTDQKLRFVRSLLVPLTMPLAVAAGIPILVATRSRRKTINFCTAQWADMTTALIGLKVRVRERNISPRPGRQCLS